MPTDLAPLVERAFQVPPSEQSGPVPIQGAIPAYLRGTCLWNGPGRHQRNDFRYRHLLDGDGMVSALTFSDSGAYFRNRFVRSEKFTREEAEGRPVFRTFGTSFPGDELKRGIGLVSPVNVSVYPFAGTLLAFGEQGLPWELDRTTLETKGLYTFGGQLNEITPFSAHAKVDHHTGELFNFGVSFSATAPTLNVFRFAPDARLIYRKRVSLPYPASTHDFAISEHYVAVFVSPYVLRMDRLMNEGATLIDALSWEPERGSWLIVTSRETGEEVLRVPAGHGYCLHMVNAFEDAGRLIVDYVDYPKPLYPEYQVIPELFTDTFGGHPVRLTIDLASKAVVDRRELEYCASPDFPAHDPDLMGRAYDHFWMLGISKSGQPGRKFFDHVVRVDWSTGMVERGFAPAGCYFGGEPIFVPDPSNPRESGVVICQQLDAEQMTSSILVWNAFDLASGPMATIPLEKPIQPQFHSTFDRHPR